MLEKVLNLRGTRECGKEEGTSFLKRGKERGA